jgi:hypothetical protein
MSFLGLLGTSLCVERHVKALAPPLEGAPPKPFFTLFCFIKGLWRLVVL